MSSAHCETFASVIPSSVGVSLHLFKARLLPTDGVLCDIPRRLCVPLATARSPRRASLWPAARGCRAEAGCPFDVARGDETPSLADHSQGAWVEADAWAGLPDCPPCLPWGQARPSQAPAPLLGGRSAPSARSGRSLPSAPQRCGPHQRACARRPLEVWSTSAQRGWIAVSQDFIPG